VDPRTLGLLDRDTIGASVEKAGRVTTFPQAVKTGEFRGEIAAMVAEEGFVIPNEERIIKEVLALIEQRR